MADLSPDQIRELDTLTAPRPIYDMNGLVGLDTGLGLNMPGPTTPAPYQPIPAGAGYQSQIDPMYLSQGEADTGDPGLGLSSEPGSPQTPGWAHALYGIGGALEAFSAGFHGREPLILKYAEQQQLQQAKLQQQAALRKEAIAQQQAQLAEQKRQHKQKMFMDVMTKPGLTDSQRQEMLKPLADGDEQITAAVEGIGKKRIGKVNTYAKLYPQEIQQLVQDWQKGEVTADDIDQRFTILEDRTKRRAAAKAEATEYARLSALAEESMRTGQPMDPGDQQEFIRLQNEQAKRQEELTALRLKNQMTEKKIEDPGKDEKPDRTEINRVSLSETGKNFEDLAPGSAEQRMVIQRHAERYAQGRTNVQMGTVPALKEQADYYTVKGLENLELEQAPKGLTEGQYRNGPYRQLDDKEKDAVVQYKVAQKTVDTMNRVANQLITAKTPAQALKQKIALEAGAYTGRNGLAAAYQKDRDAFSSRMARLVEVGVLTNTDVTRWSDTFGSFGDTVQTLKAKQALFGEIQEETQRLLKLKLGGKPITTAARSRLDELLDKSNQYRSVEDDAAMLFGGK
ncbi:MAG: hypothetical protein ABT940_00580 [Alphaproteobacteria bacterium]